MAFATTSLSTAVAVADKSIVVASATSVAAGRLIRIDGEMMQVLLVTDVVPPTPSTCRGSGEPNAASRMPSHKDRSSGRSALLKYSPRDVPPRIKIAGIVVCILPVPHRNLFASKQYHQRVKAVTCL